MIIGLVKIMKKKKKEDSKLLKVLKERRAQFYLFNVKLKNEEIIEKAKKGIK
jgi:hypothetical protein